ncbi:MAG: TonB-dependent receptor plug domain-containing protein [Alphaproteobacteria bacterium]|nr:TonB-dependent receptor plug domain-containing protein [Alphaproteobacteria bacterium]MBU1515270.1 TonB-dependent receptor plug domain-containing protein [Alphaproteobacteria bacterium]MBU2092400.1 TonB-dependent receptor plug domain-containing protein [Alphaproteobacteria bacterium]MBU2152994.1 TonB-dependent receptor plug domain-containing protein [Alphaproteobacteria bacterium]MBU2305825.1 TonB-dependent receptor plug domain-containing protein [Alphaproteobacteria bacterium]
MTRTQVLKSASIVAICCAMAAPAYAQTTGGSDVELEEVVITARKREESLREVPAAGTAFGAEQIQAMGGIANTQSLLSNVPAVNFANTSNPVTSEVSIRGSGTSRATAADSAVGLYRNGVYIGGGYVGGRTFSKPDFFDVGAIEVLRGVQGALNGRNAVGGSINIVSQRPKDKAEGFALIEAANNDRFEGQLVVNQPINENWAVRLGANLMKQSKGFYYNPVRDEYFDRQETEIYRAQVAYDNGPFKANLLVEHGRDQLPGLMYQLLIPAGTNPIYPRGVFQDKYNVSWNHPSSAKQQVNYAELTLDYDLGFGTLTSTSALRERRSQNAYDRDATSPQFLAQVAAAGLVAPGQVQGDPNLGGSQNDYARVFFQDVHLAGNPIGGFSWLGGFEYYDLNDKYQNTLAGPPTAANGRSIGTVGVSRLDFVSWAAYGSAGYDFSEAFNVTAEGRYTSDDKDLVSNRIDFGTGRPSGTGFAIDTGRKTHDFSYNVTASYKLAGWLTYAKIGTAYRAGGFNLALGDPRQPIAIPATFNDEKVMSYEVGAKGNLARRLFLSVSAYQTDVDDLLVQGDNGCRVGFVQCPVQATAFAYNAGKAELWGLEAELTFAAELFGGTARGTIGGSRQGGHIKSGPDAGKAGPQRPDWTGTFNLNYQRDLFDDYVGFFNIKGNGRWGGVQEIAQTPKLEDYQMFDVRAGVKRGPWEVSAYANNAGDEAYIVFNAATTRRWNLPRTYGAQLRYAW